MPNWLWAINDCLERCFQTTTIFFFLLKIRFFFLFNKSLSLGHWKREEKKKLFFFAILVGLLSPISLYSNELCVSFHFIYRSKSLITIPSFLCALFYIFIFIHRRTHPLKITHKNMRPFKWKWYVFFGIGATIFFNGFFLLSFYIIAVWWLFCFLLLLYWSRPRKHKHWTAWLSADVKVFFFICDLMRG